MEVVRTDTKTEQGVESLKANGESSQRHKSLLSRLWSLCVVLGVLGGSALVAFAFLLPDLDRYVVVEPTGWQRVNAMFTWVAFSVRTFDLLGGVMLLLATILVLARRMWVVSGIGVAAAVVMVWPTVMMAIWPSEGLTAGQTALSHAGPEGLVASAPTLKIANLNTLGSRARSEDFRAFLVENDPDVIVIVEYDEALHVREAEWLKERWKYFAAMPREDNFGMAVFSRLRFEGRPMVMPEWKVPGRDGEVRVGCLDPQIRAVVEVVGAGVEAGTASTWVVIQGVHPLPPRNETALAKQRLMHRAFAKWAKDETRPRVLIGDLNATPRAQSSAWFAAAGLIESRDPGRRFEERTWPSGLGTPMWLGVRIDRALASKELVTQRVVVGKANGSDHLPMCVTYRVVVPVGGGK